MKLYYRLRKELSATNKKLLELKEFENWYLFLEVRIPTYLKKQKIKLLTKRTELEQQCEAIEEQFCMLIPMRKVMAIINGCDKLI